MANKKLPASLFVGATQAGKRTLISQIIGQSLTSADSCGRWVINNNYYTAETKVVIRRPDGSKFGDLSGYEALVLVFDASSRESWTRVVAWADEHMDAAEQTDITLVVASQYDKVTGSAPTWHAEVQQWCMDNRFELVRAAPGSPAVDAQLAEQDDDAQGCPRVKMALEAHMWPGLTLKAHDQQLQNGSNQEVSGGTAQGLHEGAADNEGPGQVNGSMQQPRGTANVLQGQQLLDGLLAGLHIEGVEGGDGEDNDEGHMGGLQELDGLFAEMAGARERLGMMSDSARREAAATLALRLAGVMGLEDEDEGDDEGEGGKGEEDLGSIRCSNSSLDRVQVHRVGFPGSQEGTPAGEAQQGAPSSEGGERDSSPARPRPCSATVQSAIAEEE